MSLDFNKACGNGDLEAVKNHLQTDNTFDIDVGIYLACVGNKDIVARYLLENFPGSNFPEGAAFWAIENRNIKLLELAEEFSVLPPDFFRRALRECCLHGHHEILLYLFQQQRVVPNYHDLLLALYSGRTQIVYLILTNPNMYVDKYIFEVACARAHNDVIRILLKDPRVEPTKLALKNLCACNNYDMILLLLRDGRVDPSPALNWTCDTTILKLLKNYRMWRIRGVLKTVFLLIVIFRKSLRTMYEPGGPISLQLERNFYGSR